MFSDPNKNENIYYGKRKINIDIAHQVRQKKVADDIDYSVNHEFFSPGEMLIEPGTFLDPDETIKGDNGSIDQSSYSV